MYERDLEGTGRRLLRLDGFIVLGLLLYILGLSGWLLFTGIQMLFFWLLANV